MGGVRAEVSPGVFREVVTTGIPWVYCDGGRGAAGFRGEAGDCVVRAIAIACEVGYLEVYQAIGALAKLERPRRGSRSSPRSGVRRATYTRYLDSLGWGFTQLMGGGSGCRYHMRPGEVPSGRIIARLSGHLCAVIDGVVHDTHDPCRGGSRCLYGYYSIRS